MTEPFMAHEDPAASGSPDPAGQEPPAKRATWLWIAVGLVLAVIVTASIVMGVRSPGGLPDSATAAGTAGAAGASPTASPSGDPSAAPDAPGQFGKPSLPSDDLLDPWKGANPIDGVDPDAFVAAMKSAWSLDFRSRPLRGGLMQVGLAGDLSRKQRRLDGIIERGSGGVYEVMCQAGGTELSQPDETGLRFISDCLAQAVHGQDWQSIKSWLDGNLSTMAASGGDTWYRLPAVQMYVVSDRHVVSCTLVHL